LHHYKGEFHTFLHHLTEILAVVFSNGINLPGISAILVFQLIFIGRRSMPAGIFQTINRRRAAISTF
jgi:hypothetical protein